MDVGQVHGMLAQGGSIFRQIVFTFVFHCRELAGEGNQPVFETAIGVAQLVADLAQGSAQVLGVALVDVFEQRVKPFELVDDELQVPGKSLLGLGRIQAALQGHLIGGLGQPVGVELPGLQLVDDVAAVTGDVVGCFQGMVRGAERLGIIVELQAQQVGNFFFASGALHVAADVLVEFAQAAHHLAHVFVGLGHSQGGREILVGLGSGDELVRRVNLPREFVRLLLFDFAEGFEQGKGIIGQGDGLAVVGVLLALDPAGFFQTADEIGGVIPLGFLTCYRNGSILRRFDAALSLAWFAISTAISPSASAPFK